MTGLINSFGAAVRHLREAQGWSQELLAEKADLWFHCMIALAHYGKTPADVVDELSRREGLSGLEEKALRKAVAREAESKS